METRNFTRDDIRSIIRLSREVYTESWPWGRGQLTSQLENFPEGQFIAVDPGTETGAEPRVVGFASSLIIRPADHSPLADWAEITEWGHLGTHDPVHGDVLYGVEVMVHPDYQGKGIGTLLYRAREELMRSKGLRAIQAGARISGYRAYLDKLGTKAPPEEYVARVVAGELWDPTLSFQLKRGFKVLSIVPDYFNDPPSLDYAARIEWTQS